MSLYEQIKNEFLELTDKEFMDGTIVLRNDSDKVGDYIAEWNYSKPLPSNLKVGK